MKMHVYTFSPFDKSMVTLRVLAWSLLKRQHMADQRWHLQQVALLMPSHPVFQAN